MCHDEGGDNRKSVISPTLVIVIRSDSDDVGNDLLSTDYEYSSDNNNLDIFPSSCTSWGRIMSPADAAYKSAKQDFVANNPGESVLDIQAVSLVGWVGTFTCSPPTVHS